MRLLDAIPPKVEAPTRRRASDPFADGGGGGPKVQFSVFAGAPLSEREVEMLVGLASGMTYKEIALQCTLSTSTVRTHLHNIYTKLEVVDRAQAVLKAMRMGLIFNDGSVATMTEPLESLGIDAEVVSEVLDVLREYPEHEADAVRRSLMRASQAKTLQARAHALSEVAAHAMRAASVLKRRA